MVHRHHDEVPEEHGDVGHQRTDSDYEPEKQANEQKSTKKLNDDFHEMIDAFCVRVVLWDPVSHLMN